MEEWRLPFKEVILSTCFALNHGQCMVTLLEPETLFPGIQSTPRDWPLLSSHVLSSGRKHSSVICLGTLGQKEQADHRLSFPLSRNPTQRTKSRIFKKL